jgi:surface antigen
MRNAFLALTAALSLGVTACETTGGYGASPGYGAPAGSRLSSCMRNALIGAGIGAVAGAVAGSENNRGENAAIDNQQQARIEGAYQNALASNAPVGMNWVGASSRTYVLNVQRPSMTPGQPNCRTLNATLNVNNTGAQPLPTETYCNNGGAWVPMA